MLLRNNTAHFPRHQTILIYSESYWQTVSHTFPELTSNNTDIFKELLVNNTTNFQISYHQQTMLTFSKSYWQTISHTFPEHTSNNTDIFRELLANNTTHFSRVHIKQYWYFQRVPSKLNYSKKFFSEFISHNTDTFRESLPNNIDLFRAHIKQYSHFHWVNT